MTNRQVWNPEQYNKFKDERARPFYDLVQLIQGRHHQKAVDLGCGTGELTAVLQEKLDIKNLLGIDSSAEMLTKAEAQIKSEDERENGRTLTFQQHDIQKFAPTHLYDLVFSNAALQWLGDHEELFPKVLSWIRPGGEVAIQMPFNFDHPSHLVAAQCAYQLFPERFSAKDPSRVHNLLSLERYAEILFHYHFPQNHCRIQVYGIPMASGFEVIEWTKGTLLTGYQAQMTDDEFKEFFHHYQETLLARIGTGPYYYAFKRMLLWGKRETA